MKHALTLAVALASAATLADTTVTTVTDKDGKPYSVVYIGNGKVRAENLQGAEPSFVLYQTGIKQMTIVMPKRKTFMVMDAEKMKATMSAANEQMQQMQEQLKDLPASMRDQILKNLPNAGGNKPLIEMKVTKTGKSEQHGGYSCQLVDVDVTGIPMMGVVGHTHCVVPADKLNVGGADLATIKAMAAFGKEMTKELGQMVGGMPDLGDMGGWPVWTKDKRTGDSWGVKSVDHASIAGSMFEVPAGFKEEQMPDLQGGGKKHK